MISTTFDGQSVLLLNDAPDWGSPVGVTFDLVSQFEEGLTGREARRPYAATLRAKVKFRLTIQGADAFGLKYALRSYQTQPIIVPFWPLAETWANRANIAATGLKVAYKADWSTWELYTTVEPGWVLADDLVAPAFWGRLEDRELIWINAIVAQFDVNFIETGSTAYALVPGSQTFQPGPNLADLAGHRSRRYTRRLMSGKPNSARSPSRLPSVGNSFDSLQTTGPVRRSGPRHGILRQSWPRTLAQDLRR